MEQKVEVSVLPGDINSVVEIRSGQALELREPKSVHISGDINTVASFIAQRLSATVSPKKEENFFAPSLQTIWANRSYIEVDKERMSIKLILDAESYYGGTVTGTLELTEDVKQFRINSNQTFKREEIVKLLRFNKRFFPNQEVYTSIVAAFSAFTGTANVDVKSSSDNRANREAALKVVSNSNLPNEFILAVPVFKGIPPFDFRVEICYDWTDGGFSFWFESPELKEMIETKKDAIFEEQLSKCGGLVVINK